MYDSLFVSFNMEGKYKFDNVVNVKLGMNIHVPFKDYWQGYIDES